MSFDQKNDSWICVVEYFDDANPNVRIPRTFSWPIGFTRAQAIGDIKTKGAEVRNLATINTQGIVGNIIAIP